MSDATNPSITGQMFINIVVDIEKSDPTRPTQRIFIPAVTYHSDTDGITREVAATAIFAAMAALSEERRLILTDEDHWREVSVAYKERGN